MPHYIPNIPRHIESGSDAEPAPMCDQATVEPLHVVPREDSSCADDAEGTFITGATSDSRPQELSIPQCSIGAGDTLFIGLDRGACSCMHFFRPS